MQIVNYSKFSLSHKTSIVFMVLLGVLVKVSLQQSNYFYILIFTFTLINILMNVFMQSILTFVETFPALTSNSVSGDPIKVSKDFIIGITFLIVLTILGVCGLMMSWYKYHKRRKVHKITDDRDSNISEKSIPMEPSPALITNSYNSVQNNVPNNEKGYTEVTKIQHKHKNFRNVIIRQNSSSSSIIRQFPSPPVTRYSIASPPNNINNNNLPKESRIVNIGSELKDQPSDDDDILSASISKEERSEVSLMCSESNFGKIELERDDNIVCQATNHFSDDLKSRCILSGTQSYKQTFSLNKTGELIQFDVTKDSNDLSHLIPLNDIPIDLPNDIPVELYIDELTVAGQGTVGLKFRATEGFRIILSGNLDQSYGEKNVIVLDIGEDATYFRKCNNNDPDDILAFTSERKALLDKDKEQLYWFSLDKKNRRLRYGKGPMQSLLAVFNYDFPAKSSQGVDEYNWIENLRYVGVSKITLPKRRSIKDEQKINFISCRLPVTMDLPPFIIKHEEATLERLETGEATVIDNLPEACKELYWNIVGSKITLNTSDFPDFADAIEYSINTPGLTCYERLKKKAGGFGGSDPKKTYLRVTLGEDRGNSPGVPYVLEIWPSGHYSPIHSHSNSFAIIKILYNEIMSRYFTGLNAEDQKWFYESTFKEGQVTWISDDLYQTHQLLNRTRKVCVTIQCYQYGGRNKEHYEFFDYLDNNNRVQHFRPNSDWTFAEFKKLIKKEWDRYKYLSGNIFMSKNLLTSSNDINTSHQLDKNLLTSSNDINTSHQSDKNSSISPNDDASHQPDKNSPNDNDASRQLDKNSSTSPNDNDASHQLDKNSSILPNDNDASHQPDKNSSTSPNDNDASHQLDKNSSTLPNDNDTLHQPDKNIDFIE